MTEQVYGSLGSGLLDLSDNLKLSIATSLFSKASVIQDKDVTKSVLLKTKSGFELIEPNAIVRYLASSRIGLDAFRRTELSHFEEVVLYNVLKSGKPLTNPLVKLPSIDTSSPEQIILFSSLYPIKEALPESANTWISEFASKVEKAVAHATSITKLERAKEENTGASHVEAEFVKPQDASIKPKPNERNILITSALPYVNNVPHLGNIVGSVLSADIYARFCKARNYNTLFICGTDEYGTATETKALEEKVTPRELCTKYHKIHSDVYKWFQIGFDYFGRTTTELQTEIAQDIFMKLYNNGYLEEQSMRQLYCPVHNGFLADRYVEGECPKCHYEDARGDQCDKCGTLLDPFELINPRCKLDNASPEPKNSNHIFLSLDKLEPPLREWVAKASEEGKWSKNSRTITDSWIKEGLLPRCITRDLVWGTPVPLDGFEKKVLYVWFDATIGYISITANYTDHWKEWWKNPDHVDLYQFMGKDNVPFHTVVFPASEIGTGDKWTMLHHLSTTEYLQYEGGKFSKSRGIGVFGNNAQDSGIPPSVWRYYLASIRPESSDSQFSWGEFVSKNNNELLANLGNFVNRLTKFVNAKYNGVVPDYDVLNCENYDVLVKDVNAILKQYLVDLEGVHLRKGLEVAMQLSARGNQFLQDNKLDNSLYNDKPAKSDAVIAIGLNLIYLVGSVIYPYMPETTTQINQILNTASLRIPDEFGLFIKAGHCINKAQYLFKRIDEKKVDEWRALYGGKQVK
ncbi:BA75_02839T0 [Komagataella pastoris]|uniref:methionine--tRNA ligase n=1 Tax=Komagataella pastoris TaxID=4922 RepID=A0A1B2JCN6_PICPA|nr:BA75_02839T0 [Komagataella pastoris]